jgi:hypothetical protein
MRTKQTHAVLLGGMCLFALGVFPGCGGSSIKAYPTTGKILYKGNPLDNADVMFTIQGKDGQPSTVIGMGKTDAEGRYSIRTQLGPSETVDGAVPGTHLVTVSKYVPPKGMTEEELVKKMAAEVAAMEAKGFVTQAETAPSRIAALPPHYQNPQTSKLSAEVTPGGKNEFNFDLK